MLAVVGYIFQWISENKEAAIAVGIVLFAVFCAWVFFDYRREQAAIERMAGYTVDMLDDMSGPEFEQWLTAALRHAGIQAENIQDSGDFGLDVIATVNGTKIGIQAKRYKRNVGNDAVQQAVSGADYHSCKIAAVVTQSNFTKAAKAQASRSSKKVLLIGRDQIGDLAKILTDAV